MFTAAFTIAKTWKQPKYSSTDEWMKKFWYIHTHTQLNIISHKKGRDPAICSSIEGPREYHTK